MNKRSVFTIILLAIFAIISSVIVVSQNLAPSDSSASITNTNLKYFGYLGVDSPSEVSKLSTLTNPNVVHIIVKPEDIDNGGQYLIPKLQEIQSKGMKAILGVHWVFFSNYEPGTATLASLWDIIRWPGLQLMIAPYKNSIYGFMFDEPCYNGVDQTTFNTIAKRIRFDVPDKNLMIIEAYTHMESCLRNNPQYLTYVTDYAFDYYFTQYIGATFAKFDGYYRTMLSLVPPYTKIWVVADGFATNEDTYPSLVRNYALYKDFVSREFRVVGVLNFVYSRNIGSGLGITLDKIIDPTQPNYSQTLFNYHQELSSEARANRAINNNQCSNYSYSNWSTCGYSLNSFSLKQTRFLVAQTPYGCEDGNPAPIVQQTCVIGNP